MRADFPGCCARAPSGHPAAARPAITSRRVIRLLLLVSLAIALFGMQAELAGQMGIQAAGRL